MKPVRRKLGILLIAIAALAACSGGTGGGGNDGSVVLSGRVSSMGTGSVAAGSVGASATSEMILVLPLRENIWVEDLRNAEQVSIEADGSFSVELSQSYSNYLFVLIDESQPRPDRVLGYIALSDLEDSLISIPAGSATGDIDAGELTLEGDEAVSENDLESYTATFGMTFDELKERARSDDVLKWIKNLYINDQVTRFWTPDVSFAWRGLLSDAKTTAITPNEYGFQGYGFQFSAEGYGADFDFDDIVNGTVDVAIVPPVAEVSLSAGGTIPGPFTNDAIDPENIEERIVDGESRYYAGDGDFGIAYESGRDSVAISGPGGTGIFGLPVTEGYWTVTLDNEEIAWFDLAVGSPVDAAGNPIVPVPSFSFSTEADGRVTGFAVDGWFTYDATSETFVPVQDMRLVDEAVAFAQFYANGPDPEGSGSVDEILDNVDEMSFTVDATDMDHVWYYGVDPAGVPADAYMMETFKFEYRAYGVTCGFWLSDGT